MGYSPRYHVGYNRPVKGAIGDSPVEWHTDAETDEIEAAKLYCKNVRDNGHPKAIIVDTRTNSVVEL